MREDRRAMEAIGFVGVWIGAGLFLRLDANTYLLIGVPLLWLFQRYVRREALAGLWVQGAASFDLKGMDWLVVLLLMAVPAVEIVTTVRDRNLIEFLWWVCSLFGAIPAAFSLRNVSRMGSPRKAVVYALIAVGIGGGQFALGALGRGHSAMPRISALPVLLEEFLSYFTVCFVLEEVVFRGAIDSHVALAGARDWPAMSSALFVSGLWGLWHVPVVLAMNGKANLVLAAAGLVIAHSLVGVPLSFCWRKGGTLALPAAAHALIDAYRDIIAA
jgi:hypothetical protein